MVFEDSLSYAQKLDKEDRLARFRDSFHIPKKDGREVVYLCGNSLGLQPKKAKGIIHEELEKWKNHAVEGHFMGERPWVSYHHESRNILGQLLGAKAEEVVAMNNLTSNLHFMLASFYRPEGKRLKILMESGAFPSDYLAIASMMRMKGVDPDINLVQIPHDENFYISNDSIVEAIHTHNDELALVLFPGIQYYSGQLFNMKLITEVGHSVGAYVGFDLAHAIGNVPLNMHDQTVDFAVWCTYKYLNSGPGNVGGAFVHENHGSDASFPKLSGWWGQKEDIRFKMENKFETAPGVDGWMLSNANVLSSAAYLASLEVFENAGMLNLREKSKSLTSYLEYLLKSNKTISDKMQILTPANSEERGSQLSLMFQSRGKETFDSLMENGFIVDWRETQPPDGHSGVIRVAPTALYNTYEDAWKFNEFLKENHN